MNKALQALAAVVVILVLILTPVALFPEAVTDFVDDIRREVVEKSLVVADLERSSRAAENGDLDAKYLIALYNLSPRKWHWDEVYEKAFGPKDDEKGLAMMRELAAAGHPEALYWEYDQTGDEQAWAEALEAGSQWAVRQVHSRFVNHPCDDSLYAHVNVVRSRLEDPSYPWQYPGVEESQREWRLKWKRTLAIDITTLDSIRAETCAAN